VSTSLSILANGRGVDLIFFAAQSCRACHWSFEASAVNFTPIPGDDVSLDSSAGLVGHFGSGRSFPVSLELAPGTDVLSTKYTLPDNALVLYPILPL
jgi:hypothetical protein